MSIILHYQTHSVIDKNKNPIVSAKPAAKKPTVCKLSKFLAISNDCERIIYQLILPLPHNKCI